MMGSKKEKKKKVWNTAVMIKILIRTRTKWESVEAAGSSNFNKGFLSSILQASSLCPHYCILSSFSFGALGFCRKYSLPHSPCVSSSAGALASVTVYVRVLSRQTSSRWKVKCVWLCMRRTLKKRRIHLLWYADQWWLVCLPVFHLWKINPCYSLVPLTTYFGLWTR